MDVAVRAPVLRVNSICKRFGGVVALSDVSFEVAAGECHAVVGENGAGKTTLINILHGAVQGDSGSFDFMGKSFEHLDPLQSMAIGLNVIHQELALVDSLRVMENIFLSSLQGRHRGIVKSQRELAAAARRILDSLGCDIDPMERVEELSTSKKQIVEIAKALASDPKLLIMDEPTSSLTQAETEKLFEIIRTLKARGISIIFVSHRLNEVVAISDRVSVLRDGKYIGTVDTAGTTVDDIVRMMVGREIDLYHKLDAEEAGRDVVLEIKGLSHPHYFRGVNLVARAGEILCLAGLVGAGRTELAETIFGFLQPSGGQILIRGKQVQFRSPKDAMAAGMGLLPEDRKTAAVIGPMNVRENISIAILPKVQRAGFVRRARESEIVMKFVERLRIKTAGIEESIGNLSGGNQQKVMIARWIAAEVSILIVDEPTQGVDVGAKAEIHRLLRELAHQGVAVIVISSDLPEVLSVADRILVMRGGALVGELHASAATEEKIMKLATTGGL
jgi:ABC-type sugar transport system ATPase subunit